MSPKIQVTRRDRELAECAFYGATLEEIKQRALTLSATWRALRAYWLGTGNTAFPEVRDLSARGFSAKLDDIERHAYAVAQGRAEGFAAGKEEAALEKATSNVVNEEVHRRHVVSRGAFVAAEAAAQHHLDGMAALAALPPRVTREMVDVAIAAQDAAFNRFGTLCGATLEDGRVLSLEDVDRLAWAEILAAALAAVESENA